jgi:hypothetical protein
MLISAHCGSVAVVLGTGRFREPWSDRTFWSDRTGWTDG